jgi:hypothetical protein
MPTTLTLDVEKEFEQSNGTTTTTVPVRYVAAYNPVLIKLFRKDWEGSSQESTAIPGLQAFDLGSLADDVNEGDFIFVATGFISLDDPWEVIDKTGNLITINVSWAFGVQVGYINLMSRKNWYLTLKVGTERIIKITPLFNGFMSAEISGALQTYLELKFFPEWLETSNPSYVVNKTDALLNKDVTLSWKENWIGSDEAYTSPSNNFEAIAGAFNIGNPNNGFYTEYYPNNFGSNSAPELLPKWLTVFERPVYWSGFFFTKSLILPETLTGSPSDYELRQIFIEGNVTVLQQNIYTLGGFSFGGLNQVQVNAPDPAISPDTTSKVRLQLLRPSTGAWIIQNLDCIYIAESKISCNNFYVRWLNPLGGWEYWLFEHNIYEGQRVESLGTYETYFDQLADTTSYQNSIGKRTTFIIQCGTDVFDENTAKGLRTLSSSIKVEFLNQDTNVWIGVQVVAGSFQYRKNKATYNRVELSFELPTEFNQTA